MKIAALAAVVALTCGTAFAAQDYSAERDANSARPAAVSKDSHSKSAGGGIVDKTKRAFHRMGDKMRSMGKRSDKSTDQAARDDTRSMGAAGTDTQDSSRKRRMDDAYANWQSKQHK